VKKVPSLRGVTVCNAFYEASTRTRLSFELAAKRLSADTLSFSTSGSSVAKGETLLDTVRNIEAMRVDMVVIRHSSSGAPQYLAKRIKARVINAGDGFHEHPTRGCSTSTRFGNAFQILTALRHHRGRHRPLQGRPFEHLGSNEVRRPGHSLRTLDVDAGGDRADRRAGDASLEEAVEGAQVVMALRVQRERMEGAYLPSTREYARLSGSTPICCAGWGARWSCTRDR